MSTFHPLSRPVRVLFADFPEAQRSLLAKQLVGLGFNVFSPGHTSDLEDHVRDLNVDLLLLACDGEDHVCVARCSSLRGQGIILPILVLMRSSFYGHRVAVLQAGADDVLSHPYALEELVARVHALFRRSRQLSADGLDACLNYADLSVDPERRLVTRAGSPVKLTVKEYDLLVCLLRHKQQILSRQRLLHLVWGDTWVGDDNLLDVYIRYLRKKIERPDLEPLIHTVRGVGFVLK